MKKNCKVLSLSLCMIILVATNCMNFVYATSDDRKIVDSGYCSLYGEVDETTGKEAILLFLDDTNDKLQVVTSSENIVSEDEIALESNNDKSGSFFEEIKYSFVMILIVLFGIVGGTIGPWIGSWIGPLI